MRVIKADNLNEALSYLRLGWAVFPLETRTKKPHPRLIPGRKWGTFRAKRASEDQVRQWWTQDAQAGIGLVLGQVSNVVCLDFDGERAEQLARDSSLTIPSTTCSRTGGGGLHFLFRCAEKLGATTTLLKGDGCHVEFRAEASYAVSPPSMHPSGNGYEWLIPPEDIADLPDHIRSLVQSKEQADSHNLDFAIDELPARFQKLLAGDHKLKQLYQEPSADGDQSGRDFAMACRCLARGLTERETASVLWLMPHGKRQRDNRRAADYVVPTVRRAFAEVEQRDVVEAEVMAPKEANALQGASRKASVQVKSGARSKASIRKLLCDGGQDGKLKPNCPRIAEHLHDEAPVFSLGGRLYRYENGVYRSDGEESLRRDVALLLSELSTQHRANEVVGYLRDKYTVSAADIDADLQTLNVANGLLKVNTLELRPHDPQYLTIVQVPVEFHQGAECPQIGQFFRQVFPLDCVGLAYEVADYCLRRDLEPRTATLLLGPTHAGKSTYISLITHLAGDNNVVNVELQDFAEDRFPTAQLFGKMVNCFADLPSTPLRRSSTFKAMTGGDRLSAQEKYGRRFDFKPYAKLLSSANRPPGTRDYSDAYYVRWRVVPFPNQFLGINDDTGLPAKLTAQGELEGLLVAALHAAMTIPPTGRLSEPPSVREANNQFRQATDTMAAFAREVCTVGEEQAIGRQQLFDVYRYWCDKNSLYAVSQQRFNVRLEQVAPSIRRTKTGSREHRVKYWQGIGIAEDSDYRERTPLI